MLLAYRNLVLNMSGNSLHTVLPYTYSTHVLIVITSYSGSTHSVKVELAPEQGTQDLFSNRLWHTDIQQSCCVTCLSLHTLIDWSYTRQYPVRNAQST